MSPQAKSRAERGSHWNPENIPLSILLQGVLWMIPHPKLFPGSTTKIIGRIPCFGMAVETFSRSFDSTSLPLRGREVPLRMTGIKFIELTCCGNQTDPLPTGALVTLLAVQVPRGLKPEAFGQPLSQD